MIRKFIARGDSGLVSNKRNLAVGAATGLACGAVYLPTDADLAAAVGFIICFSLVAGAWVSFQTHTLAMRIYAMYLHAIDKQLDAALAHADELGIKVAHYTSTPGWWRRLFSRAVLGSFALTPVIWLLCVSHLFAAILFAQIDHAGLITMSTAISVALVIFTVILVGGQYLYLAYLHRQIVILGRQVGQRTTSNRMLTIGALYLDTVGRGVALSARVGEFVGAKRTAAVR